MREWSPASLTAKSVNKTRVQLDFSNEAMYRLDQMVRATGHHSKAETIQQALRLYEWLISEAKPNDSLLLIDENGNTVAGIQVKGLLR